MYHLFVLVDPCPTSVFLSSLVVYSVQVNAFPPSPKSSVDLYVSSNHDDSDATITLRFPTFKTLNGEVPDIRVELVMG